MVVGGGVEPPMFTTWVAVLQTAVLDQLDRPYDGSWAGIRTQDYRINGAVGYHYRTHELKLNNNLRYPLQPIRRTGMMQREPRVGIDPTSPQATEALCLASFKSSFTFQRAIVDFSTAGL